VVPDGSNFAVTMSLCAMPWTTMGGSARLVCQLPPEAFLPVVPADTV
jgi:hypothetical protein